MKKDDKWSYFYSFDIWFTGLILFSALKETLDQFKEIVDSNWEKHGRWMNKASLNSGVAPIKSLPLRSNLGYSE